MRLAVVTGNPKPASRTHGVALAVAGALSAALTGPGAGPAAPGAHLVVDLSEHAPSLFDSSATELSRLTAEVAEPELGALDTAVARWAAAAIPLIRGALAAHEANDA